MSQLIQHISKHFNDLHFGGNWTWSNVKDQLSDVTWQEAITPVQSLNTIAILTFHINYFVAVIRQVLEGGKLEGDDKLSFDHPPITCAEDWVRMKSKTLTDAEVLTKLIAVLPEEKLWETFGEEKYGNYYRNLNGLIEHTHYHLGQIALVKKLLRNNS